MIKYNYQTYFLPEYDPISSYPETKVMPLLGGMFKLLFMFPRNMALKYKRSYRQWFFDRVNLHAIRGPDVKVSSLKIYFKRCKNKTKFYKI